MKMKITQVFFLPWVRAQYANEDRAGTMLAFGALLLYGTYNAFAKGLTVYLSPISLLLLSEALTSLFVVVTIGLLPLINTLCKARGRELMIAIFIGILSSGIAPLLWFKGLTQTTAVNASILTGSSVIFALLFDWLLLKEKINSIQMAGTSIVFLGIIAVAIDPTQSFTGQIGDLYIILKGIFFGLGTALFKRYLTGMNAEVALFLRSVSGICFALILSAFLSHPFAAEISSFPMEQITILLSFVFFSRFLHLTFFYAALDRTSANKVALINHATPLSGLFFAVVLLGEHLHAVHVLGALLMIIGLMVEHLSAQRITKAVGSMLRFRHHQQP